MVTVQAMFEEFSEYVCLNTDQLSVFFFQFGVGILSILLGRAAVISNGLTESDDDIRKSW